MQAGELPTKARRFWDACVAAVPELADAPLYEAFCFGDGEAMADDLAALVLAGTKRATASLVWAYEAEGQALPAAGNLSIVTTWDGEPLCIIRTESVEIVPFDDVTAEFARTEGEGDKSLDYWRAAHWKFFTRACAALGREPTAGMPIACETFSVVYPPEVADRRGA